MRGSLLSPLKCTETGRTDKTNLSDQLETQSPDVSLKGVKPSPITPHQQHSPYIRQSPRNPNVKQRPGSSDVEAKLHPLTTEDITQL